MIKSFVIFFLAIAIPPLAAAQEEDYVCTPCGHPCDDTVVKGGGTCKTCGMTLVLRSSVKITNLSAKAFCEGIAANPDAIILDVRSEKEFDGSSSVDTYGHFKKAININVNQITLRVSELKAYKDKEIFIYCSQNYRSPRAAHFLNYQGFTKIKNLVGGLSKAGDQFNSACYKEHFVKHKK